MKGFCDKRGFPLIVKWLSCLEGHVIIERFNATLRGLAEFFLPMVKYQKTIHRWVYIIRYACLKTLANKYSSTISQIFKRFGTNMHSKRE